MSPASSPLDTLGRSAGDFARTYVRLVEALRREGVPEDTARQDARAAATAAVFYGSRGATCTVCGSGEGVGP